MTSIRRVYKLLPSVFAALALSACTSTQVKDGSSWAAREVATVAVDVALQVAFGEPKYSADDVYEPDEPVRRDFAWEQWQEMRQDAHRAEVEERKRRAESRAFKAEFDEFMERLESAERTTQDPPLRIVVAE